KRLNIPPDQLDPHQFLNYLGLDSLIALELRNLIKSQLQVDISTAKLMSGSSVVSLTTQISQTLQANPSIVSSLAEQSKPKLEIQSQSNESNQQKTAQQMLENLDQLPDQDVDALLKKFLSN
ncbi:MAG: acyl carrier protein, partial [Cyanobacteriota bacterium]|nr:acyl carrier protein [Cyanobacteriota bacterium]